MAKTSTATLEDFIKKYTQSGAKSYSEWLSSQGQGELSYESKLRDADYEYDRALSTYGKKAEVLSRGGLGAGGYAAYIDANAYSEMQNAKQNALREKNVTDTQNRYKYSDYLKEYESDRHKVISDTLNAMRDSSITDADSAYEYALYRGIPDELATELSRFNSSTSGINALSAKEKSTLITTLASKGYSRGNLYYLLTALGMSQDEANELADTIYKLSKDTKKSDATSYFDD